MACNDKTKADAASIIAALDRLALLVRCKLRLAPHPHTAHLGTT
jgi:hypothetical protein